jgi:hypothetical protein
MGAMPTDGAGLSRVKGPPRRLTGTSWGALHIRGARQCREEMTEARAEYVSKQICTYSAVVLVME